MLNIILISLGGVLGTLSRYFLSYYLGTSFSFNILFINYLGSFLAGGFFEFFNIMKFGTNIFGIDIQKLIFIGFLGAFTTFSTYSLEAVKLFLVSNYKAGIWYIIVGNIGAIIATLVGIFLVKHLLFFIKS